MKRAGTSRDAAFFMPALDRIAAALRITDDNEAARHVGTDVAIAELAPGIRGGVKCAVVFHERRRLAHAALEAIRDIDMEFAKHLALDEIMTAFCQRTAINFYQ